MFRTGDSLAATVEVLDRVARLVPATDDLDWVEVRNLIDVGRALVDTALRREESRGSHTREDHPDRVDRWLKRQIIVGSDHG